MVRWCFHERIIYSGISTSRGFSMFPSLNSPACYVWLPNGISPLLNSKKYPVSPHFHHTNWFIKMFLKNSIHVPSTIPFLSFFHIFFHVWWLRVSKSRHLILLGLWSSFMAGFCGHSLHLVIRCRIQCASCLGSEGIAAPRMSMVKSRLRSCESCESMW